MRAKVTATPPAGSSRKQRGQGEAGPADRGQPPSPASPPVSWPHWWLRHVSPLAVQSVHEAPCAPQLVSRVPGWHVPRPQQPFGQDEALHPPPPPASRPPRVLPEEAPELPELPPEDAPVDAPDELEQAPA